MASLLSTSSSESATRPAPAIAADQRVGDAIAPLRAAVARRRSRRRLPSGALCAVLIVVVVHVLAATVIYPQPMPRRDLRRKVIPLTEHVKPILIIFGDSRAECGFIPRLLATEAGIDGRAAVNIAVPACEVAGGVAAYREFADRFAPAPTMLVSVSLFSVNDRATADLIGQESLWALGPVDRLRVAPVGRALAATFLPERELLRRYVLEPLLQGWDYSAARAEQGYRGKDRQPRIDRAAVRAKLEELGPRWFNDPVIDGVRWRLLEENLDALTHAGVQVVLVDPPEHPLLLEALAGTPRGEVNARFHARLADLAVSRGIPLLRYRAEDVCPDDPRSIFVSVMHLNRRGAERISRLAGRDLHRLIREGSLHVPAVN